MPILRYYSSVATPTTLAGSISAANTTITVDSTTGFPPNTPYTLAIDFGSSTNELVDVTNVAGTTLTVTRGADGTSAQSHSLGAVVRHVASGRDFSDYQNHQNATSAHGVSGALVGTTDAQILTNKTLNGGTLNGSFAGSPSILGTTTLATANVTDETFTGVMTGGGAATLRLTNTTDVSLSSTGHAFQIGPDGGANLRMDGNEIMSVNNGATSTLEIQPDGGNLRLFNATGATLQVQGTQTIINTLGTGSTPLLVRGISGQSANILTVQDSGTSSLLRIDPVGRMLVDLQSTSGTAVNVNTMVGFSGLLLKLEVDAADKLTVDEAGTITTTGNADISGTLRNSVESPSVTLSYASGWAQDALVVRRTGQMLMISVNVQRTGAAVGPASATGNITDTDVFTVPASFRPLGAQYVSIGSGSYDGGAFLSQATGILSVRTLTPTASIGTGDVIGFTLCYPIA